MPIKLSKVKSQSKYHCERRYLFSSTENKITSSRNDFLSFRRITSISNGNFKTLKPLLASGVMLLLAIFSVILNALPSFASSVSISVANSPQSFTLLPTADTPAFGKSGSVTAELTTDSTSGYTFTVTGPDDQNLVGVNDSNNIIPSISKAINETTFENGETDGETFINTWGFLPSKLNGEDNTNYLPGPQETIPTTIDVTSAANDTANTYTFAIATKVDSTQAKDSYSTTFTLAASANATNYSIGFVDLVGNMPPTMADSTTATSVTLPSQTPTKSGYIFKGWCSVATTDDTCSGGTVYQPGASYNLSNGAITNLYAIWRRLSCDGYNIMQNVSSWSSQLSSTGSTLTACDSRDYKLYTVAKLADGKIWMTQNLDYEITSTTLTPDDSDVTSNWAPAETAYTANNVAPAVGYVDGGQALTTDAGNWVNSDTAPYSVEGGDVYYYTSGSTATSDNYDTLYTSLSACASAHSEAECKHYHRGNYYNWTAAIASNDSSSLTTKYATAPNSICPKGWRLPVGASAGSFSQTNTWFAYLLKQSGVISAYPTSLTGSTSYATNGLNIIRTSPLYLVRSGYVHDGLLKYASSYGYYWSSSVNSSSNAYNLNFSSSFVGPASLNYRKLGRSVRCVAR